MQGAGNDYIYVNGFEERIGDPARLAQRLSNRHFGIGSDGLVLIMPSERGDFRMRMFNADGSEAEMCGNASRCVGKYVFDNGLTAKRELTLETQAGVKRLRLFTGLTGKVDRVCVDMGEPVLAPERIPVTMPGSFVVNRMLRVGAEVFRITCVSMGNPHAVVFTGDEPDDKLLEKGRLIEHHPLFPQRTNVEFVRVVSPELLEMRVWERGAGETMACGTGACAALVAAVLNRKSARKATVRLRGGDLEIEWRATDNRVYMAGEAVEVFRGEIAFD